MSAADLPRVVQELARFVGLGDEDLATVRRTAPVVLAHDAALADAVYEHFLAFPFSARFFMGEDGTPDQQRLGRRKHSLTAWLRATAEATLDHDFTCYALAVGLSHSHRAHGPGGAVPLPLMVGAMSLVQTALWRLFDRELGEPRAAAEASVAWSKLLTVQLVVLLQGYLAPSPR